jgi:hypothetical protein
MEEPTVLDYVKSKIFFWRGEKIRIPPADVETLESGELIESTDVDEIRATEDGGVSDRWAIFPPGSGWTLARLFITLGLALLAQRALEPPTRSIKTGVMFYIIAAGWLIWSNLRGDWKLASQPEVIQQKDPLTIRKLGLWICIPLAVVSFILFGETRFQIFGLTVAFGEFQFNGTNLILWGLAIAGFLTAFWLPPKGEAPWREKLRAAWGRFRSQGITFSTWTLLVLGVFAISAFYRFSQLDQIPAEMFSDHAEKLIDVGNVLDGETSIYFPRNTGREAFQMYLTAAMALIFNTGLSFTSLKLGTAFCGLFTIPFIYLLGKEVANRRVGLLAMFLAGIAYWPNVISRVALRFTLYPTFTAPALYFLIRGLRRQKRNDFILSGIFLGIGLHGYSPFRFVPIVVLAAVGLYLLHHQSKGFRGQTVWGLALVTFSSLLIFLPLFRYALHDPAMFSSRMMTRMGQTERAFPGNPVAIFFENLWNALTMFWWDDGQIWVHSIPYRPALEIVSAVLFFFGLILLIARYFRRRNWLDAFLLFSIPLLMMPSVLSLAFPDENPSLNRTGGALVIVFLVAAMALDGLLTTLKSSRLAPGGTWLAFGVGAILLIWSASQNYGLVFEQYNQQFRQNAWNTSELGAVIRQFVDSSGAEDSAWVVPYPHWVDTRLVGIRAGFPKRDYALWRENISSTLNDPRAKLFLVKPEDQETIELLRELYPTGVLRLFDSQSEGRDFYMYSVPPTE